MHRGSEAVYRGEVGDCKQANLAAGVWLVVYRLVSGAHTQRFTHTPPEVRHTRSDGCSLGSTASALWQPIVTFWPQCPHSAGKTLSWNSSKQNSSMHKKFRQCGGLPRKGFPFVGQIASNNVIYYFQRVVCFQVLLVIFCSLVKFSGSCEKLQNKG